jgi:membrane associated rhomboid family serine protease
MMDTCVQKESCAFIMLSAELLVSWKRIRDSYQSFHFSYSLMPTYSFRSSGNFNFSGGGSFLSPMIKTLMLVNVGVFLFEYFFLGMLRLGGVSLDRLLLDFFGLQPLFVANPFAGTFYPWQLISYQFMHGGFMHLLFNMFALWMFGKDLEDIWGARRFLLFYLLSGAGAGLIQLAVNALFLGSPAPIVGASGAIYGVLLAFGLSFPDRPIIAFPIFFPIPARIYVLLFAGLELIQGLTGANNGVARFAHVGGALVGYILLKTNVIDGIESLWSKARRLLTGKSVVTPKRKIHDIRESASYVERNESATTPKWFRSGPPDYSADGAPVTQERVDAILDKIREYGINSLTKGEREILERAKDKL